MASCMCLANFYGALDNADTCVACDGTCTAYTGSASFTDRKCPTNFYGALDNAAMCVACDGARTADAGSALVSLVGSVRRTSVEP